MNNTFIDMIAAIKDPAAIERAYTILSAKRALIEYNQEPVVLKKMNVFTAMEPRPIESKPKAKPEVKGRWLVRIKDTTAMMKSAGFQDGMVFEIVQNMHDRAKIKHARSGRVAIVKSKYLESFFKPDWDGVRDDSKPQVKTFGCHCEMCQMTCNNKIQRQHYAYNIKF